MILFERLPTLLAALILLLVLLLAARVGFARYRWFGTPNGATIDGSGPDTLLAATLGLLALLLGFTFALAMDRNEERRDLVIQEANALSTAWLRSEAFDEPGRSSLRPLLRSYAERRLQWSLNADDAVLQQADTHAQALARRLWRTQLAALRTSPGLNNGETAFDALNEALEAAGSRIAMRADRLPRHIINLLLIYTLVSAAMIGWRLAGSGHRYQVATTLMLLLLSMAISAIVDLDQPRTGNIQVSQQPLIDAVKRMN